MILLNQFSYIFFYNVSAAVIYDLLQVSVVSSNLLGMSKPLIDSLVHDGCSHSFISHIQNLSDHQFSFLAQLGLSTMSWCIFQCCLIEECNSQLFGNQRNFNITFIFSATSHRISRLSINIMRRFNFQKNIKQEKNSYHSMKVNF